MKGTPHSTSDPAQQASVMSSAEAMRIWMGGCLARSACVASNTEAQGVTAYWHSSSCAWLWRRQASLGSSRQTRRPRGKPGCICSEPAGAIEAGLNRCESSVSSLAAQDSCSLRGLPGHWCCVLVEKPLFSVVGVPIVWGGPYPVPPVLRSHWYEAQWVMWSNRAARLGARCASCPGVLVSMPDVVG